MYAAREVIRVLRLSRARRRGNILSQFLYTSRELGRVCALVLRNLINLEANNCSRLSRGSRASLGPRALMLIQRRRSKVKKHFYPARQAAEPSEREMSDSYGLR